MITLTKLQPGDVLMLKSEKDLARKYLIDNFGKNVANMVTKLTGQKYLHSEMYLEEGWVITATPNGVHLQKYDTETILENFDIFRSKNEIDTAVLRKEIKKHHNKRYDWLSLYWNIADTISSIFGLTLKAPYDTKFAVICSELIARVYESLGLRFQERAEFITSQDIVDSGLFYKI